MHQPSTLERAFELARSGNVASVNELRRALIKEHHDQVERHLAGRAIQKQLIALIEAAQVGRV